MRELNGFEIEVYNQYKFKDGSSTATCPECSEERKKSKDKCVSLDWSSGFANCHHCGVSMQLHSYKKKETNVVYKTPPSKDIHLSDKVIGWFLDRGISQTTLKTAKVSEGPEWMPQTQKEENTIQFNYYVNEELINVKYRDSRKNFKMYKDAEKVFYNIDSCRTTEEVVICEGEIDALSFIEAGIFNVVSVPNGFTAKGKVNLDYLDNYFEYFDNKDKIFLALDNDEAGDNGKEEFVRRLGADRCYIVDFKDCKDANEFLIKYDTDQLIECLVDSSLTPLENIVILNDTKDDLEKFWESGFDNGMTVDLHPFDESFSIETKQYTMVTGVPQSGKSEFLDHMLVKLNLKYKEKIAYCSIENEPFVFHHDKIFQKIYGKRPKGEEISSDAVMVVRNHISDNFFHVKFDKRYWLQDVLDKFKELVRRKGVRIFVIDPFNKVRLKDGSEVLTRYTEEYHNLLDEFCKRYDAHIFLVAHPVKSQLQEGSSKTYVMPHAYSVKGGGEHFDMTYNMIAINRIHEFRLVNVKTLKVKFRHLGEGQVDSYFSYNTVNGRYEELQFQPHDGIIDSEIPAKSLDYKNWLTGEVTGAPTKKLLMVQEDLTPNLGFDEPF